MAGGLGAAILGGTSPGGAAFTGGMASTCGGDRCDGSDGCDGCDDADCCDATDDVDGRRGGIAFTGTCPGGIDESPGGPGGNTCPRAAGGGPSGGGGGAAGSLAMPFANMAPTTCSTLCDDDPLLVVPAPPCSACAMALFSTSQ